MREQLKINNTDNEIVDIVSSKVQESVPKVGSAKEYL